MKKTVTVQVRIEKELEEQANAILASLGMNATTAITIFYSQIVRQGRIPFDLKTSELQSELGSAVKTNKEERLVRLMSMAGIGVKLVGPQSAEEIDARIRHFRGDEEYEPVEGQESDALLSDNHLSEDKK